MIPLSRRLLPAFINPPYNFPGELSVVLKTLVLALSIFASIASIIILPLKFGLIFSVILLSIAYRIYSHTFPNSNFSALGACMQRFFRPVTGVYHYPLTTHIPSYIAPPILTPYQIQPQYSVSGGHYYQPQIPGNGTYTPYQNPNPPKTPNIHSSPGARHSVSGGHHYQPQIPGNGTYTPNQNPNPPRTPNIHSSPGARHSVSGGHHYQPQIPGNGTYTPNQNPNPPRTPNIHSSPGARHSVNGGHHHQPQIPSNGTHTPYQTQRGKRHLVGI